MQKYLKILEKNVQWIALGLGGIYFLFMVWNYVINPPVSVKVGNKELYPDNIDEEIYTDKGKALELAMGRTDSISIPETNVLEPYLAKLDEKDAKATELKIAFGGTRGELITDSTGNEIKPTFFIAKLPQLPPATYIDQSHSITTVLLGAADESTNTNPNVQPVLSPQDTNWVSLKFQVNMLDVQKAFNDAFKGTDLPRLFVTRFLQVELLRQEKIADGKWSDPVTVKTLPVQGVLAYPGDVVDPVGPARQAGYEFKNSAGKQVKFIITPTFPKVAEGAPVWFPPGQSAPEPKGAGAGRTAATPKPGAPVPAKPSPLFAAPAAGNGNAVGDLGEGEINLASANGDQTILAHDLTAEDGKTYRYAVRYKIANPVWDSGKNLAAADLTKQFALVSPLSEWSKEINIESHTRLFVTNVNKQSGRVTFDLFEWKDKQYHRSKVDASAGDAIKDWTVVDVRQDNRESYILLLDGNGKLTRHSKRMDSDDPTYDKLKLAANEAAAMAK